MLQCMYHAFVFFRILQHTCVHYLLPIPSFGTIIVPTIRTLLRNIFLSLVGKSKHRCGMTPCKTVSCKDCTIVYYKYMAAKNTRKDFIAGAYYHIYNRGVEKRTIFMDSQDYAVFLRYLTDYLMPKDESGLRARLADPETPSPEKDRIIKQLRLNNFSGTISLLAYCLMPNHFHFLVKQTEADTIDRFTNSLFTRYSSFFNRKHKRVGKLFEGIYKAVPVTTDEQLLHLTRYIHRNPLPLLQDTVLQSYRYSSYQGYLGSRTTEWVHTEQVSSFFSSQGFLSYESFVEDRALEDVSREIIRGCLLDDAEQ